MCAEEKQTRASRPFSLNPTGTLSRRVPAQFVCAVDSVHETANRVRLAFAAACPEAELFRSLPAALMASGP
jgi:hypothetical protein